MKRFINLPAMIYYGVNSDKAILMRINNVPRSAATEMGVEYKKEFGVIYQQFFDQIKQWIEGIPCDK